nr:CbtA family protein [Rubellimicrobium arenae]
MSGALIAGLAAGLLAAALNLWTLTPLILQAEAFEGPAHSHAGDGTAHDHGAHDHDGAEGLADAGHVHEDASGLSRSFGTIAMTLVAYAGFGLVLGAGMAAAERAGHVPSARTGVLWGLAGFAAVQLAPAVGLPPELPGTVSADLAARQMWWALCAASTATGLAALAFGRGATTPLLGVALILVPHLLGAPQPPSHEGLVPPGLAAAFATRSLGVAVLSWAVLGALTGALSRRAPARVPA